MEHLLQQSPSFSSATTTSTSTSASSASTGVGSFSGLSHASTADSVHGGISGESTVLPPRRRLVKTAARAQAELKREGLGGPPGFGGTPVNSSPLASSGIPTMSGTGMSGLAVPPSLPGSFRDRERLPLRSSAKADLGGDLAHGISGSSKPGRSPHLNAGALEARHLGRRPEVNSRRHEPGAAQKHAAEQQAKRASLLRAQTSGAPGNFKTFDSSHNNYLVPVIPLQFAAKQ